MPTRPSATNTVRITTLSATIHVSALPIALALSRLSPVISSTPSVMNTCLPTP